MSTTQVMLRNSWPENNNNVDIKNNKSKRKDSVFDRLAEIAARELREDETTRQQCLEQLQNWIRKNEDIENCIEGRSHELTFPVSVNHFY